MFLQPTGIVVACKIEVVKTWDDTVIHNLDYVWLLLIFRHAIDDCSIFSQRWRTKAFAIAFNHFGQIEIHLITGAVLDKSHAVAVFDLAAHGGDADGRLGTATKL